jgi:hypothetical protein
VIGVDVNTTWETDLKNEPPTEATPFPLPRADTALATDPLPSWNDAAAKQSIVSFVKMVTKDGSPSFVPVAERIATFDNDGTLSASSRCPCRCTSHATV